MAIPQYDRLLAPYNDELLEYDYDNNRYYPTVEGVFKYGGVNLVVDWTTKENAQTYLYLLSAVVYDVILSYKDSIKYKNIMLYYLAHSKEMREWLANIFIDTAWYNRRDGGFMMAYNSGANLNQGKLIEFGIDKALSSIAKQKIMNSDMGSRVLKYNINNMEKFNTLDELKSFLFNNNYITQEQYENADNINKIPKSNIYRVFENSEGKFVFEDTKTYEKIINSMKKYNSISGTW